jgi:hypothetical protein
MEYSSIALGFLFKVILFYLSYSLLSQGGIVQSVPCTAVIFWYIVRPSPSSNHYWFIHQSFTFPPKEGVLRILITLKSSSSSAGFEPTNLRSNGKHANHYTTEATNILLTVLVSLVWLSANESSTLIDRLNYCIVQFDNGIDT